MHDEQFRVALLYPQSGPAGLFGPSCRSCAGLAVHQINGRGGIGGRELVTVSIDAAAGPRRVNHAVSELLGSGSIDAIVGWQTSDVRHHLAREIERRVPYVYTALYEGGERTDGVFLTGETPDLQVGPAMVWLQRNRAVRTWYVVGSRYRWPQRTAVACRSYADRCGTPILGEAFVPLGTEQFETVLDDIQHTGADAVLMLLLGQDAVAFNRAFAARGLDANVLRFSPLMDENMLLASGAASTRGLLSSAGYFESLTTSAAMDFNGAYYDAYGPTACVPTSMGESCFEGMLLLESLVSSARTSDVPALLANERPIGYEGPRGQVSLRGRHVGQPVYLAAAQGCEFAVIDSLVASE